MEKETPSRTVKWVKRVLLGLLALVVACCVGFAIYASNPYEADDLALATISSGGQQSKAADAVVAAMMA